MGQHNIEQQQMKFNIVLYIITQYITHKRVTANTLKFLKKLVLQDLDTLKLKRASDLLHIKKGIQTLTKRKDIVIRPADKGGEVVIHSKEQYMKEIDRQLLDESTYVKLLGNPTTQYKKELEKLVHLGIKKEVLNKKESKFLIPESCRIPVIYTVLKLHKDKINPPGRPIVNGIESLTSRMGQYFDNFIQPAYNKQKHI